MSYIRSALLIGQDDFLDVHAPPIPDAVVFDMSKSTGESFDPSTMKDRIRQSSDGLGPCRHVRFSIGASDDFRTKLLSVFSHDVAAVWISGISEAQQVRDADVEIRRLEMEHGIDPGTISLIPELNSVRSISLLDTILTAVDRVATIALNLDLVCADLVGTGSDSSDDLFVQRHILANVALKVAAQNLLLIVTNLDSQLSTQKMKMVASTGATGMLTRDLNSVASLNDEFVLTPARIDQAQTVIHQWSSNPVTAQENGVTLQAFKRATHIVGLANQVDAR